jgi:hypothetical protein
MIILKQIAKENIGHKAEDLSGPFFFLWRYSPNLGLGLPQ